MHSTVRWCPASEAMSVTWARPVAAPTYRGRAAAAAHLHWLAPQLGIGMDRWSTDLLCVGLRALNVRRDAPLPPCLLAIASFGRLFIRLWQVVDRGLTRRPRPVRRRVRCTQRNKWLIRSIGMEPISRCDPWALNSSERWRRECAPGAGPLLLRRSGLIHR